MCDTQATYFFFFFFLDLTLLHIPLGIDQGYTLKKYNYEYNLSHHDRCLQHNNSLNITQCLK
jgi:hypothetical protein